MGPSDRRRALLAAFLSPALALPGMACARDRLQVVGCLSMGKGMPPLAKPLAELGYVEGQTLRFDLRSHNGSDDRALAESAQALVAARPDALVTFMPYHISALLAATRTIPIVCGPIPDPVGAGFAQSLRRPGGNVTGLSTGSHEIWPIVIGLLRTLRPRLKRIVVIHSPEMPVTIQMRAHRDAAEAAGLEWSHIPITSTAEVERALQPFAGEAVHFAPISVRGLAKEAVDIAHRHRIMTFGGSQGALMGYWRYFTDEWGRIAVMLDKLLKGAHAAEIPFELPDRTHFSINRAVARSLGIEIPADMLLRATEVIG
jgi:putative ABC transport system substrate-binding protein